LFRITISAIKPGTQPQKIIISTIKINPHPLSKTEKVGKN